MLGLKLRLGAFSIAHFLSFIKRHLTMKTPQTPSTPLTQTLGSSSEVWLKREDKHHYGSHKGRSIPLMLGTHFKSGYKDFVISSSGNAALAAIHAVQAHNKNKPADPVTLTIFIGELIAPDKEQKLHTKIGADTQISVTKVTTPKQAALQYEKERKAKWLRQSTDDIALLGYAELAKELAKIDQLQAVFIPTSSGTTALGLHVGFKQLGINPQIHIVQTTACHPIVDLVAKESPPAEASSIAGAIVDKVALRKNTVADSINFSHGAGWIVTNEEILTAQQLLKEKADIEASTNGALAVAGLSKAIKAGFNWTGPVVCLITGP